LKYTGACFSTDLIYEKASPLQLRGKDGQVDRFKQAGSKRLVDLECRIHDRSCDLIQGSLHAAWAATAVPDHEILIYWCRASARLAS
jgi:hypothetical protein